MNIIDVFSLLALVAIFGILALLVLRCIRTVETGYVAIVYFWERLRRVVGAGPYILWPWEEEKAQIFVRTREVTGTGIPNIFTHGGLPVTVMLDYEMRLAPELMTIDELQYDDAMRKEQQVRIIKGIVQRLVREATPPAPSATPDSNQVNIGLIFSPFLGQQLGDMRDSLESEARAALLAHGIELMAGSLLISWLSIPGDVISAYTESLAQDFSSASRHKFITRLREAAPTMSDMGLVQLFNVIEHNPADIRTIFAEGGFDPAMRIQEDGVSLRTPLAGSPPSPPSPLPPSSPSHPPQSSPVPNTPVQTSTQTSETPSPASQPTNNDLPLTEEDMATLRSLFD